MNLSYVFALVLLGSSTLALADVYSSKAIKSPDATADIVLMCEEIQQRDIRLEKSISNASRANLPWSKFDESQYAMNKERNERIKRPFFALKYRGGMISFNNEGAWLLIDETPGVTNRKGLVGDVLLKEDTIHLRIERLSEIRTNIDVDRFTGLYKSYQFHGDELLYEADGKCVKYSEKLF